MTLKNLYIKETCERQCITQIWNHSSICTFGFVNVNVHNKNMISFWRWMKTGPTHSCQNRLRRESNCSLHSTISATPPVLSSAAFPIAASSQKQLIKTHKFHWFISILLNRVNLSWLRLEWSKMLNTLKNVCFLSEAILGIGCELWTARCTESLWRIKCVLKVNNKKLQFFLTRSPCGSPRVVMVKHNFQLGVHQLYNNFCVVMKSNAQNKRKQPIKHTNTNTKKKSARP